MDNLIYVIAVALIAFWVVGFFVYSIGAVIHLLLIVAAVTILFRVMRRDRPVRADRKY